MKKKHNILYIIYVLLFSLVANSYFMIKSNLNSLFILIPLFLYICLFGGVFSAKGCSVRMRICYHGAISLLVFITSVAVSLVIHSVLLCFVFALGWKELLWSALVSFGVHFVFFWDGIICVYLTSYQLGVKQRVIGALCGMIPIANLFALRSIINTTLNEIYFETEKEKINELRKNDRVCETKYPILLVHGVFFRDTKFFNYWGRIPRELERNGATVFYGNQHSAASISDCAEELTERIKAIVKETDCGKVNIIAHSKGGLDSRYAIEKCGIAPYVASLTTINTPHRGCMFADYLLTKIPEDIKDSVANAYNKTLKRLGDSEPDFLAAVNDLRADSCEELNKELPTPKGIYCQSVGSTLYKAGGGKFPLNFSYILVKLFDGKNDGLVSESSFEWGERYTLLTNGKKRGISHGDMIDLNRENIEGFDVREFYVELVSELKEKGL